MPHSASREATRVVANGGLVKYKLGSTKCNIGQIGPSTLAGVEALGIAFDGLADKHSGAIESALKRVPKPARK